MTIIDRGTDGYYHPSTEAELQALVAFAYQGAHKLRVRGAAHSVARAIYTDGYEGEGPPPQAHVEVMLDRFAAVTITPDPLQPGYAIVAVEAGCHLGLDPYDPTHTSTWANSLNYQLQQQGYALENLGGITHQTVGGYLATGASGGSVMYSVGDTLLRLRLIDGTGGIHDVSRDDPDPQKRDLFFAAGVSMGLLGVISKVWLRARPTYDIVGEQVTTTTGAAPIDLFGPGTAARPSLEQHLEQTPYARLMWWPQRGFDRIQVWHAERVAPAPGALRDPYQAFAVAPDVLSLAGSLFYTIIGNLGALSTVPGKLTDWFAYLNGQIQQDPSGPCGLLPSTPGGPPPTLAGVLDWLRGRFTVALQAHPELVKNAGPLVAVAGPLVGGVVGLLTGLLPHTLANLLTQLIQLLLGGGLPAHVQQVLGAWLTSAMPKLVPKVLEQFVPIETQHFRDTWMCGLPMDNQMDDRLWKTKFNEMWIPLDRAAEAMKRLRDFYAGGGDPGVAYSHTGAFACELYAAGPSEFWMSPSYGRAVLRVDVFWFAKNAGEPTDSFYPQFWELLRDLGFVPHWGKHLPLASPVWRAHYRAQLPRLEEFLALRADLDPQQIFVSSHWREHLGIP